MDVIEMIREAMQHNEEKKRGLRKSILMLMLEWKNFEEDFDIASMCLRECFNELEAKEKHLTSVQESVTESSKEVKLIRESIETKEEEFRAFREREIRDLECKWKEFSLAREGYDEVLKFREEKLNEQEKLVERLCGETEFEHKQLADLQKSIENRFKEISTKEEEFQKKTDDLHLKERKFMERAEEFEMKEKYWQSMEKEMEAKEKALDSTRKELMVASVKRDNVKKELREKETMLASVEKELREKEHNLDSVKKKLELQEQELTSCKESLQLREEGLNCIPEACRHQLEEVETREKRLESVSVSMQKRDAEVIFKKQLISETMEDIAHKEKQLQVKCRELEKREACKLLEEKEKKLKAISSALLSYMASTDTKKVSTCKSYGYDPFAYILVDMGGKNLQTFLKDNWEELELLRIEVSRALTVSDDAGMLVLEAVGGFYHKEEIEHNGSIIRKICILLLEELVRTSLAPTPTAKLEASKLASEWKEKMMAEIENHLTILGFLLLVRAYGLASDFDKNELESLCCTVAQHEQVTQICHALGISVNSAETLPKIVESSSKQQKDSIVDLSSDPAKIVLDLWRKYYSAVRQESNNVLTKKRKRDDYRIIEFSLLLKQLREVSPEIGPQVKLEATKFAVAWRPTLTGKWEVQRFFDFLTTFALSSSFDSYDLLGLLGMVSYSDWTVNVIKILGLTDKVSFIIENLIRRREWYNALKFTYEFELVGLFPPLPLLKQYVSDGTTQAKQLRGNGKRSRKNQHAAIFAELRPLRDAVRFIVLHNLQSEYSPDPLSARISELESEYRGI